MDENNINGNVNPNEEVVNEQPTQTTPEPEVQATPEPEVQQNANQGAYEQPNQNYNQNTYNQNAYSQNNVQPANDGKATASLVCGIVSFFCCGIVLGIIAIVLGNQYMQETGDINNSKAKAGKICGIVSIALNVVVIIIYLIAMAAGVSTRYY